MILTEQTLRDFRNGQLETFYQQAYASLMSYAMRMLGETLAYMAEDCVQDVILQCYERRRQLTTPERWKALLYRSLHNRCVDCLRKDMAQHNYLEQQAHGTPHVPDHLLSIMEQETIDTLFNIIESLPPRLRRIFELSFEQGLRNEEVAQAIGLSLSAVKKQKHQLVEAVRKHLSPTLFTFFH